MRRIRPTPTGRNTSALPRGTPNGAPAAGQNVYSPRRRENGLGNYSIATRRYRLTGTNIGEYNARFSSVLFVTVVLMQNMRDALPRIYSGIRPSNCS